jgi:hypothetical protein
MAEAARKHRVAAVAMGTLVLLAMIAGAVLFQPWRLFTSSAVDEAPPAGSSNTSVPSSRPSGPTTAAAAPVAGAGPAVTPESAPSQPATAVLATGGFQSQEHATSGTASLLRLPDGSHVIRLENLASSDGPDVKVWLSSQEAGGDWFKYRSGQYLDLGPIKATHGNQNYAVPAGAELKGLRTVVLWCDRFSVAFGSAPLA